MIDLAVIIVNYQTPKVTVECLASLQGEMSAMEGVEVVVVDNGSGDASEEEIAGAIHGNGWDWAKLAVSQVNRGFAAGNNFGLENAEDSRFVLFLNSDTLVHPGALRHCLKVMKSDESVGCMSCRLVQEDGRTQNVARKFPTPARLTFAAFGLPWKFPHLFGWADVEDPYWDRDTISRRVDWIGGAFMMVRSSVLEEVGPMNDGLFFYGEDIELCHRICCHVYLVFLHFFC